MQMVLTALVAIAAVMAGCSSVPQSFNTTMPPPADRVLRPDMILARSERAPAGYVALPIVRDSAFALSACAFDIVLNDVKVVQLRSGEGVVVRVPEGRLRVRLEFGGIVCPVYSTTTEAVLSQQERLMLRTGVEDFRAWAVFGPAQGFPDVRSDTNAPRPAAIAPMPGAAPPAAPPQRPIGVDSYIAERLARQSACNVNPTANLIAKGPGFETFSVQCTSSDVLMIRCESGNCRALK